MPTATAKRYLGGLGKGRARVIRGPEPDYDPDVIVKPRLAVVPVKPKGTIKPYNYRGESIREKVASIPRSIASGLGANATYANRLGEDVAAVADFIPGVGDAIGVEETVSDWKKGNKIAAVAGGLGTALGVVPVVGKVAGKVVKKVAKKGLGSTMVEKSPVANVEGPVSSVVNTAAPKGLGGPFRARGHHGSKTVGIEAFDLSKSGTATDKGQLGRGVYLSTDPKVAKLDPHQYEAEVSLENPLHLTLPDFKTDKGELIRSTLGLPKDANAEAISDALRAKGYDGVVLDNSPTGYKQQEIMVLDPKSAPIVQPKGLGAGKLMSHESIVQSAKDKGIDLVISPAKNRLVINKIVVPKGQRNQGLGSSVMQEIIDYADQNGLTLSLDPSVDFGGSKTGLKRFYGRHGFESNLGSKRDFEIMEALKRKPRKP